MSNQNPEGNNERNIGWLITKNQLMVMTLIIYVLILFLVINEVEIHNNHYFLGMVVAILLLICPLFLAIIIFSGKYCCVPLAKKRGIGVVQDLYATFKPYSKQIHKGRYRKS